MVGFPMASADGSPLDDLDKVRLVLDYAPAEALESLADDEEELELLASLDARLDRQVEATRVREETVVLERPAVVELLGVGCPECQTAFEVEADGPLPRPHQCPSCEVEGVVEPRGDGATFVVPTPEVEEEPDAPVADEPEEEEVIEEPASPPEDTFVVPEAEGDRVALLSPASEDALAAPVEPAVDPVDALVPDEEPEPEPEPEEDPLAGLEGPAGQEETDPAEDEVDEDDEEFTFTPPTAQEDEEETDGAVQDLLEEDVDLETEDEDDRSEAFDDVDWPEEEEEDAFDVVEPLGEDPEEAPDPEEELVEPEEEPDDEAEWPELEEEGETDEEAGAWPELEDEDEEGWPELGDEDDEPEEEPEGDGNPGSGEEVPSEWAGRDLEAEAEEPEDAGPAAGARGGLPVEQLPGVESFYADQLEESGYETTADLAADEAWEISDATGIATGLVKRWRQASVLVQDLGVGAGYAGLLAESDLGGPEDLRGRDPGEVAREVNDLLEEADADLDPVTPEDAAAWS
jgi:hypothetical protein